MLVSVQTKRSSAPGAGRVPALVRHPGLVDYADTYDAMRRFNAGRDATTADELWVLEHPPVYTAGIAARPAHFPRTSTIPLVRADRGGQITYHGPGQVIVYTLIDLDRLRLTVRGMVALIEQAVIDLLDHRGVKAERRTGAPGVYVAGAKIAALGLRVRGGCCYHGVALNVDMDLAPFADINPCGYEGLPVTQLRDLGQTVKTPEAANVLATHFERLMT